MVALSYDDNAASFFAITLLVLYLIPATWHIVHRIMTFRSEAELEHAGRTKEEVQKLQAIANEASGKRVLWSKGFRIFCWVTAFVALVTLVLILRSGGHVELAQYDPYGVLGVSIGSSAREIKNAYRKLSLYYHPDKPTGNAEMFQKIAKAYEALTDPVARENYEKYGNPDGRQALEVSIGLPSWMATGATKWAFLGSYLAFLVIAVPWVMHRFHRSTSNRGPGGLHLGTWEWLKYRVTENTAPKDYPEIVCGVHEYKALPMDPKGEEVELKAVAAALNAEGRLARPVPVDRAIIPPPLIIRNSVLLHAHLSRAALAGPKNVAAQAAILKRIDEVNALVMELCIARTTAPPQAKIPSHLNATFAALEFSQMVTQALYGPKDSSLRQVLPEDAARYVSGLPKKSGGVATLLQWLRLPESARPGLSDMSPAERDELSAIVADLPCLDVKVEVGVLDGDSEDPKADVLDFVAEGDVVTAIITLSHANLLAKAGAKSSDPVPPVYAPRFPAAKREDWWLFLTAPAPGGGGAEKLISAKLVKGAGLTAVHSERVQFLAPDRSGKFNYRLHVRSPVYMGLDQVLEVPFEVKPRSEVPAFVEHEEDRELDGGGEVALESMMGGAYVDDSDDEGASDDEDGGAAGGAAEGPANASASGGAPASAKKPTGVTGDWLLKHKSQSGGSGGASAAAASAPAATPAAAGAGAAPQAATPVAAAGAPVSAADQDDDMPSLIRKQPAGGKKSSKKDKKDKKRKAVGAAVAGAAGVGDDSDDDSDD